MLSHYNMIAQCYPIRLIQADPHKVKILAVMPMYHGKLQCLKTLFAS